MLKLIPEWRKSWRMLSVQCMGAALALQGAWTSMPAELQQAVPAGIVQVVTVTLLGLGIVGRLVVQPKLQPKPDGNTCPHCGSDAHMIQELGRDA